MLLNYGILKSNDILYIVLLIIFSISLWYAFDFVFPQEITVREYERHSFWVFAMHENVGGCVIKILYILLPKEPIMAYLNFVLSAVITLWLIEMICRTVKRISPKAYELLSGAR